MEGILIQTLFIVLMCPFKFPRISAHPQVLYSSTGPAFAMCKTILRFCCVDNKRFVNREFILMYGSQKSYKNSWQTFTWKNCCQRIFKWWTWSRGNEVVEKLYCICQCPEYGKMIRCNHPEYEYEWFHYDCVEISKVPRGKWSNCVWCNEKLLYINGGCKLHSAAHTINILSIVAYGFSRKHGFLVFLPGWLVNYSVTFCILLTFQWHDFITNN